jgi:hypothetical protein
VLVREALARLLRRQPLPGAEVELAQARVEARVGAERERGVPRPGQVAADHDVRPRLAQDRRGGGGLRPADVVERGVELALDAA